MSNLMAWLSDQWWVRWMYDLFFCRGDFVRAIVQRPVIHQSIGTGPLGCVLDDGCGRGMYTPFLRRRARFVVGIDVSEDHLRTMVRRYGRDGGVRFLRASAEALPFQDSSFDFLLCTEVLEHLRDDRKALGEVARVLAPGGRAIMSVPVPPAPIRDREHVREGYTPADIEPMISGAGLEVGEPRYCLFGISRIIIRLATWYSDHVPFPLPSLFKLPLYLERLSVNPRRGKLPYNLVFQVRKPCGHGQRKAEGSSQMQGPYVRIQNG